MNIVASQAANINPMFRLPPGTTLAEVTVQRDMFILKDESEVARFRIDGWQLGMEMNANPNLTLDVAVDEIPAPCHHADTLGQRLLCIKFAVFAVIFKLAETVGLRPDEKYWIHAPPW